MRHPCLTLLLLLPLQLLSSLSLNRTKRVLGIFQVVNFPNDACTANSLAEDVGDQGLCLSNSECDGKGGMIAGSCASGFGACCVFYTSECGGKVAQNTTYIRNPGYPSPYTTASTCTWTFPKVQADVCNIRLDFDVFTIAPPATTGVCSATDYFQVSNAVVDTTRATSSGNSANLVCGENSGFHLYIEAGPQSSNSATLKGVTVGTSTQRKWKIKVIQILCSELQRPPLGCLQYHMGVSGSVNSLNFNGVADDGSYIHLADQYYRVCVRREAGYCRIGWTQATSPDKHSFHISRPSTNYKADNLFKSGCGPDYIRIVGGSNYGAGRCLGPTPTPAPIPTPSVDRYCGHTLNCDFLSVSPATIVTDWTPFELEVNFNPTESAGTNNRGFHLIYHQLLC